MNNPQWTQSSSTTTRNTQQQKNWWEHIIYPSSSTAVWFLVFVLFLHSFIIFHHAPCTHPRPPRPPRQGVIKGLFFCRMNLFKLYLLFSFTLLTSLVAHGRILEGHGETGRNLEDHDGECIGDVLPCDTNVDTCIQAGCSFNSYTLGCDGWATACESMHEKWDCLRQEGCEWVNTSPSSPTKNPSGSTTTTMMAVPTVTFVAVTTMLWGWQW